MRLVMCKYCFSMTWHVRYTRVDLSNMQCPIVAAEQAVQVRDEISHLQVLL
jgi:hypothetical protein